MRGREEEEGRRSERSQDLGSAEEPWQEQPWQEEPDEQPKDIHDVPEDQLAQEPNLGSAD